MKYKLVIFDLDGTILDTLEDLAITMNHVLAENGMPVRSDDEIRLFYREWYLRTSCEKFCREWSG